MVFQESFLGSEPLPAAAAIAADRFTSSEGRSVLLCLEVLQFAACLLVLVLVNHLRKNAHRITDYSCSSCSVMSGAILLSPMGGGPCSTWSEGDCEVHQAPPP
jgi:hypothetical protein